MYRVVATSSTQNVADVEPDFGVGTTMLQEKVPVAVVLKEPPFEHVSVAFVAPLVAV